MRLRDKLARNGFTKIVEVIPPGFNADPGKEQKIAIKRKMSDFLERIKRIENVVDAIIVADMRDLGRLKLSTIYTASVLRQEMGVEAVPVITARDSNKPAIRAMVLTAFSYGIDSLMFAWGDPFKEEDDAKNVYDYSGVSRILAEARSLATRTGMNATLFATADLSTLPSPRGRRIARARLENGASYLLAQPPTGDSTSTFENHARLLTETGLRSNVLLNVFPFRGVDDIERCRQKFGWKISTTVEKIAANGEVQLMNEARKVAARIEDEGLPGIYVSTRGKPELARLILE